MLCARSLTRGQLSMIAIGGAIGTGLFLGSGLAIGFAGPSVLLSYSIGALISLLPVSYTHLDVYKRQSQHNIQQPQEQKTNPEIPQHP